MKVPTVLYVVLGSFKLCSGFTLTDDDYKKLPPIYDMDDYSKCKDENKLYCKIKFTLKPYGANNSLWEVIQNAKKEQRYFFHDIIHRKRCIPKYLEGNIEEIIKYSTQLEDKNLENVSLYAYAEEINCAERASYTTYDYILLFTVMGYLALVAAATIFDILSRRNCNVDCCNDNSSKQTNRYILALSVLNNWQKMKKTTDTPDYLKLKSLMGIKVYNLISVVMCHSVMNINLTFVSNTRFLEDYPLTTWKKLLAELALLIVQTNFLISAWLFIFHLYIFMEKEGKLTIGNVIQTIVYRYLRFIFPLTAYVFLSRSSLFDLNFYGPQNDLMDLDNKACKAYGWATLFFLNNLFYFKDTCNISTWFLSCYFQMFVITLLSIYLILKLKFRITVVLGMTLIISWLVHAYVIHSANLGGIYKMISENMKLENTTASYPIYVLYTSLSANFESYIVGLIFGTVYYRYRNRTITANSFIVTALWAVGFFGLPTLVVLLSTLEYSPAMSTIMGASLKPLFSLGIGIGILGMSHNIGGFIKKICEWRVAEFVSKSTYTVYIFHFRIVMSKNLFWKSMTVLSELKITAMALMDVVLSFSIGLVLYLLVEAPFASFVNTYLGRTKVKSS